jgi:hypothetical protein
VFIDDVKLPSVKEWSMSCPHAANRPQFRWCSQGRGVDPLARPSVADSAAAAARSRAHVGAVRRETIALSRVLNVTRLARAALRLQH